MSVSRTQTPRKQSGVQRSAKKSTVRKPELSPKQIKLKREMAARQKQSDRIHSLARALDKVGKIIAGRNPDMTVSDQVKIKTNIFNMAIAASKGQDVTSIKHSELLEQCPELEKLVKEFDPMHGTSYHSPESESYLDAAKGHLGTLGPKLQGYGVKIGRALTNPKTLIRQIPVANMILALSDAHTAYEKMGDFSGLTELVDDDNPMVKGFTRALEEHQQDKLVKRVFDAIFSTASTAMTAMTLGASKPVEVGLQEVALTGAKIAVKKGSAAATEQLLGIDPDSTYKFARALIAHLGPPRSTPEQLELVAQETGIPIEDVEHAEDMRMQFRRSFGATVDGKDYTELTQYKQEYQIALKFLAKVGDIPKENIDILAFLYALGTKTEVG